MRITKETPKERLENESSDCRRCGHCCTFGSGWVLEEEIPKIASHLHLTWEEFKAKYLEPQTLFNTTHHRFRQIRNKGKPYGRCIFRSTQMTCEIQDIKPLHCRVTSCKTHGNDANEWFIVNHFVRTHDPESVREWNLRLTITPSIPGADVESLIPKEEYRRKVLERCQR